MDTSTKISVVIPVYNAEKHLGECLDSVLGQTLKEMEVICVDDGSTDGSAAVLSEYAAKDPRVKVLTQQNAGPGPARNRGMDVATGECIAFMDPDDKYPDEGVLECLYSALQDSGCAIAGGKAVYFPADFPGVADLARVADAKAAFPHFGVVDFREYQWPYRFWCYIFRRSLLDGIRFPALRTFQDVPFFAVAMAKAGRFLALDRITYAYRQHEGNGTRNLSDAKKNDRLVGIRMVMDIAVKYRYWRMFDNMRRRFRLNGQKFGFTSRRLLSIVGLRNEAIHRFRKVLGFTRAANAEACSPHVEGLSKTYSYCLQHLRNDISTNAAKGKKRRLRAIVKRLYILLRLDGLMRFMCRRVWRTNPRKVVFSNFWGRGFADNPKYIALALLRRGVDADLVWLAREPGKVAPTLPKGIRAVQYGGTSGLRELATAAVRVDNQVMGAFLTAGFAKKPDQIYIQTWHGSLGLKKIGFDFAAGSADQDYRLHVRKLDGAMVDYLISNSSFESEIYRRQWMGGGRIMEFGHPRNDILFGGMSDEEKARVRATLGIPDGAKTFLYAPTFRDDDSADGYDLDYAGILAAARARFGGEWRMMVRRHPRMTQESITLSEGMIDASDYPDMQEILSVVDAMVTDYSSCICDFLFTGRPAFIHARDLARYGSDRGFYYPLSETPFPISETPDALLANIRSFDEAAYAAKTGTFIAARGCVEDGRASERVADLICERIGR